MVFLASVFLVFLPSSPLQHRQGYWVCSVFYVIIAFYGIDKDIGFRGFWIIIAFQGINPRYWLCSVFVSSSLFKGIDKDIGFRGFWIIIAFQGINPGYWLCSVFVSSQLFQGKDKDIGFVQFESLSLLQHSLMILHLLGFKILRIELFFRIVGYDCYDYSSVTF